MSGYEWDSQISSTTEYLKSCKDRVYGKHDIEKNCVKHGIE